MSKSISVQLASSLKTLRLPSMRKSYKDVAAIASQESWSYEQYLLELSLQECQERQQKKIARLLRDSKLPLEKSFSTFDRKRLPFKVNAQVSALLDGTFLNRTENILAFGNPGSGKTHLLCAIGHELVNQGRRVHFKPSSILVQELLIAKRELKLPKMLKQLSRYEALIIDDIGYVQQDQNEMEVLFTLFAYRYERGTIMLTSNLPFSKWEKIFKDPMTTAAAIDRLIHHSVILELNLTSYRLEHSKQNKEKSALTIKEPILGNSGNPTDSLRYPKSETGKIIVAEEKK